MSLDSSKWWGRSDLSSDTAIVRQPLSAGMPQGLQQEGCSSCDHDGIDNPSLGAYAAGISLTEVLEQPVSPSCARLRLHNPQVDVDPVTLPALTDLWSARDSAHPVCGGDTPWD